MISSNPDIVLVPAPVIVRVPVIEGVFKLPPVQAVILTPGVIVTFSVTEVIKKIAVITPTLSDRSSLLYECQRSVEKQTWQGEILHAISEDISKIGPSAMRNSIVESLDPSFKWIAFVDDDDKIDPDHLAVLVANSEGADIIYTDSREEGFTKTWQPHEFNHKEVERANYIPVTALMRRSLFEKIGGFSTVFPGEDQDLFLRADLSGARFRYVPQVTWTYRKDPQHRGLSA